MRWVGESPSGRLAPAPASAGHVAPSDPALAVYWFYARRSSGRTWGGPGPIWGSEPSAVGVELPLLRDTWRHRTRSQSREQVRGRWPGEVRAGPWDPAAPPLRAVGVGIPAIGYRQWPPSPPQERLRTRRWGHYCDLALHNLKPPALDCARCRSLVRLCPSTGFPAGPSRRNGSLTQGPHAQWCAYSRVHRSAQLPPG